MSDECVIAVYPKLERAEEAIERLASEAYPTDQISLVTVQLRDRPDVLEDLKLRDDSMHDAAMAAGLGALVGVLSGLAVIVVSGLGATFLMGPVGGGIVGGVVGGYMGAMAGWGVHDYQLKHFQRLLEEGNVLVIAHGNPLELSNAHRVLEETAPVELHTYSRAGDELPEAT
jgi:uncharacterized membrane protein